MRLAAGLGGSRTRLPWNMKNSQLPRFGGYWRGRPTPLSQRASSLAYLAEERILCIRYAFTQPHQASAYTGQRTFSGIRSTLAPLPQRLPESYRPDSINSA